MWIGNLPPDNWDTPQVVAVYAIDDAVIDGGDAKSFARGTERASTIRGPLTIEGGTGDGVERPLSDPYLLPEENNNKVADSTLTAVDGTGLVLTDSTANFPVDDPKTDFDEGLVASSLKFSEKWGKRVRIVSPPQRP